MRRAIFLACLLTFCACAAAKQAAEYNLELEACLQTAKTCDEYVACRSVVAQKYNRPFSGSCADGGQ